MLSLVNDPRRPNPTHGHGQGGDLNLEEHHTAHVHRSYPPALLSLTELEATLGASHAVTVTKRLSLYKFI